jgi:hypothetical protein
LVITYNPYTQNLSFASLFLQKKLLFTNNSNAGNARAFPRIRETYFQINQKRTGYWNFLGSGITQNWSSGKLSNFEYLMWLNVLSSRSFHDPSQYPIFPWILSDYNSPTIDLHRPEIFRDLSKPLGAIGPERLAELVLHMEDMRQFTTQTYLYSSYCSFPLALFLYLIRLNRLPLYTLTFKVADLIIRIAFSFQFQIVIIQL